VREPNTEEMRRGGVRRLGAIAGPVAPYLFLAPMVLMTSVFLIYPAIETVRLSFMKVSLTGETTFIGLANYLQMPSDPNFLTACINTTLWVGGVLILQVGGGLLIAVAVNASPAAEVFKRILYLPATLSGTVVAIIWYFIFDPSVGLINLALHAAGLGFLAKSWLSTPPLNTYAMIVASTWQGLGVIMVMFLVGLQNIPRDVIEAAQVDGAHGFHMFRRITLPMLRPMTLVVVALALIGSVKVFDIVEVMTAGGPYRSSETLGVTVYREAFELFHQATGAADAVALTIVVLVISMFYMWTMFRRIPETVN